jgi:hypothetical protein
MENDERFDQAFMDAITHASLYGQGFIRVTLDNNVWKFESYTSEAMKEFEKGLEAHLNGR